MPAKKTTKHPAENGGKWIRPDKRLALYLRDGMACCWCGASVEEGEHLTLDHVIPVSRGGNNEADNLVTSCRRCNSARGNRTAADFAESVAEHYQNLKTTADQLMAYINQQLICPIDGHRKEAKKILARRRVA